MKCQTDHGTFIVPILMYSQDPEIRIHPKISWQSDASKPRQLTVSLGGVGVEGLGAVGRVREAVLAAVGRQPRPAQRVPAAGARPAAAGLRPARLLKISTLLGLLGEPSCKFKSLSVDNSSLFKV